MTCPSDEALIEHALAGPSHPDRAHVEGCPRCRAALAELSRLCEALAAPPPLSSTPEAFVARAVARTHARTRWLTAAAAVLVLGLGAGELVRRHDEPRARGSEQRPALPQADVLYVRGGAVERLEGAVLRAGDAFAVRAGNPGDLPVYLMAFAVDAAGEVHWLYPAWTDPAADPTGVPLAPHSPEHLLDELVAPEGPARGPLRIYAVLSARPLGVRAVEAHLAELTPASGAGLFSKATIHRWSATWND